MDIVKIKNIKKKFIRTQTDLSNIIDTWDDLRRVLKYIEGCFSGTTRECRGKERGIDEISLLNSIIDTWETENVQPLTIGIYLKCWGERGENIMNRDLPSEIARIPLQLHPYIHERHKFNWKSFSFYKVLFVFVWNVKFQFSSFIFFLSYWPKIFFSLWCIWIYIELFQITIYFYLFIFNSKR